MKYSFDLTAQPWIPCIMSDGTAVQVGLQEALSRAHEIREILSPSPLVTVSLHRLLLAILHRNFGPSDAQQWRDMWQSGQFAAEPVDFEGLTLIRRPTDSKEARRKYAN